MAHLPAARRFTVDEYYRMAEAGILGADDRVELIEGEIIQMSPIGGPHAGCVNRLNRFFMGELGAGVVVAIQNPVHLGRRSEPQPDVAVLRPRADGYSTHPEPPDVLLLVEVADTSEDYDRSRKIPLYARHAIPEVWLVALGHQRVEVYRDPAPDGYRTIRTYRRGERITPERLPQLTLPVETILG